MYKKYYFKSISEQMANFLEDVVLFLLKVVPIDECFNYNRHGWCKQEWFTTFYQQIEDTQGRDFIISKKNMKVFLDDVAGQFQKLRREKEAWQSDKNKILKLQYGKQNQQLVEILNQKQFKCSALVQSNILYEPLRDRDIIPQIREEKMIYENYEQKVNNKQVDADRELEEQKQRNQRLVQQNETLNYQLSEINKQFTAKQTEIYSLNLVVENQQRQIASLNQVFNEQSKLSKQLQDLLNKEYSEGTARKQSAQLLITNIRQASSEFQLKLEESEKVNRQLNTQNEKLNLLLGNKQLEIDSFIKKQKEFAKKDQKIEVLNATIETIQEDKKIVQLQYDDLLRQFQTVNNSLDRQIKQKINLQKQLYEQKEFKQAQLKQLREINEKEEAYQMKIRELNEQIIKLQQEYDHQRRRQEESRCNSYFQNEVISDQPAHKKFIVDELEKRYNKKIVRTRLIYKLDAINLINFHKYIDDIPNLIIIIKVTEGVYVAGYTNMPFRKKDHGDSALILSLQNRTVFTLKPMGKAITYDDFYLIFGNSEIRIKSLEKKIFSNFGIANGYFQNYEKKVDFLLNRGKQNQIDIDNYEIYQIIFQGEEKIRPAVGQFSQLDIVNTI